MKLLIVDDSALVRRSIESVYRGQKFTEIKTASDGLLAVTLYKEFAPDVVTLDITMPYMDGLAALTEMLEHNSGSKILVISALADHHTAIEALKRGADQFICKPFSDEDLREALDDLVFESSSPTNQSSESIEPSVNESPRRRELPKPTLPLPRQYPSGYVPPPTTNTPEENPIPPIQPTPMTPPDDHPFFQDRS